MSGSSKRRQRALTALGIALILTGVIAIFREWRAGRPITGLSDKAYFTTDDTITGQDAVDALFVDSVSNVPPFDHNGKTAYRAVVYQSDGKRWVNNLRRYNAATLPNVQAAYAQQRQAGFNSDPDLSGFENGLEVKAPGPGKWVKASSDAGIDIAAARPPAGVNVADLQIDVP